MDTFYIYINAKIDALVMWDHMQKLLSESDI